MSPFGNTASVLPRLTVPNCAPPSRNLTLPVGVVIPAGETVAVNVTDWPEVEGLADEAKRVAVTLTTFATCRPAQILKDLNVVRIDGSIPVQVSRVEWAHCVRADKRFQSPQIVRGNLSIAVQVPGDFRGHRHLNTGRPPCVRHRNGGRPRSRCRYQPRRVHGRHRGVSAGEHRSRRSGNIQLRSTSERRRNTKRELVSRVTELDMLNACRKAGGRCTRLDVNLHHRGGNGLLRGGETKGSQILQARRYLAE